MAKSLMLIVPGRLSLEPLMAHHAAEMFKVLSDPAMYEFENAPPASEDALRERYKKLESRRSPDGTQAWLNWVIRLPTGQLAGCVQATVFSTGVALVAYELASCHWRQGLGSASVVAMLDELSNEFGVTHFAAVLKAANHRSTGLLRKLGFEQASADMAVQLHAEADEVVMTKPA